MDLLDLIFPKKCFACGKTGLYICDDCLSSVRKARPICFYCRKPSIDGMTHSKCKKKLGLDHFYSIWIYEGVIRKAILQLKYRYTSDLASSLCDKVLSKIKENNMVLTKDALLVPIPLHGSRKKWRGFNQSEITGQKLAKHFSYYFVPDLLLRTRNSIPQANLKKAERIKNIRGVFSFNSKYEDLKRNFNIIIFDDVATTGSTLKEAVKVLKHKKFEHVSIFSIART